MTTLTAAASDPASARRRDRVRELLAAYELVQAEARELQRPVWVRVSDGFAGRHVRVPLPTILLDQLLRQHVLRSTAALRRRYHAVAALAQRQSVQSELDALEDYERSVAPVPTRRLILAFVLAVLVGAFLLSDLVFRSQPDAHASAAALRAVLTVDRSGLVDTLQAYDREQALGALFIFALAICVALALPASAARVKRILLASYSTGPDAPRRAPLVGVGATGVYELEQRVFAAVEASPPREVAIDRLFARVVLTLPLWLGVVLLVAAPLVVGEGRELIGYALAAAGGLILAWTLVRLARLERPQSGRWLRTLAASVGAAAAVAAAIVLPSGPALAAADVVARFSDIAVRQNVSFASYVAGRVSRQVRVRVLDRNGAVVSFRIRLVAPSGSRVQSRYVLEDARNGRVFTSALGPAFGSRGRETMAAGLDPRSLFLFRLSPLSSRSGPELTTTTARSQFWVPFPRGHGGTYVIRVQLYDRNGNALTQFRTRPLDVAPGRFRTTGRFSSATVRG